MSNAYRFSQAVAHDYYDNLGMINEGEAESVPESLYQPPMPRPEYPLGKEKRVDVLLEANPFFKKLVDAPRNHSRFPLYTDKELGLTEERELFNQNLIDSVSIVH